MSQPKPDAITRITVSNFKSLAGEHCVEIRPLTLLAGANSSGKSSLMQALLLLKQTVECPHDPGPLEIAGPNVRFSSPEQMFSRAGSDRERDLTIGFALGSGDRVQSTFRRSEQKDEAPLALTRSEYRLRESEFALSPSLPRAKLREVLAQVWRKYGAPGGRMVDDTVRAYSEHAHVYGNRCFLAVGLAPSSKASGNGAGRIPLADVSWFAGPLGRMIHVPGLRGNPERTYHYVLGGPEFTGTFEAYAPGLLAIWKGSDKARLDAASDDLRTLGLTWKVEAKPLDYTQVEVNVGRLPAPKRGAKDLVNIADVGFGVSQVLPAVVALQAAEPGQLVYLEQPELHLHPRAQAALAKLLANAAQRGVRVVAETHSSLLLLAVQSLVAEGALDPKLVLLHWFQRNEKDGATKITPAELDEAGRFGEWPMDFDDVSLGEHDRYLEAVDARLFPKG